MPLRLWMCWVATPRLHRMWLGSHLGMPRSRSQLPPAQSLRSPIRPLCHCRRATTQHSSAWRTPLHPTCPRPSTPRTASRKKSPLRRVSPKLSEFRDPCQHPPMRTAVPLLRCKSLQPPSVLPSPQIHRLTAQCKSCNTGHKLIKRKATQIVRRTRFSHLKKLLDLLLLRGRTGSSPSHWNTNQRLERTRTLVEKSTRAEIFSHNPYLKSVSQPHLHLSHNQVLVSRSKTPRTTGLRSSLTGSHLPPQIKAAIYLRRVLRSRQVASRTQSRPRSLHPHLTAARLNKLTCQKHNPTPSKSSRTIPEKRRKQILWNQSRRLSKLKSLLTLLTKKLNLLQLKYLRPQRQESCLLDYTLLPATEARYPTAQLAEKTGTPSKESRWKVARGKNKLSRPPPPLIAQRCRRRRVPQKCPLQPLCSTRA